MRFLLSIFFLLFFSLCSAQYIFSGSVEPLEGQRTVYLSIIEDYRKSSNIYTEQIIAKTVADTFGFFQFEGNMLDDENRMYRIHVDRCSVTEKDINHFNGACKDSKALVFIANNNDNLSLPFSFENEIFCKIESTNPKANTFAKIDSLKNDMRFAYTELRSEANRKLNNKKWFKTLQDYGESLNEPLAELYIYNYLSDRTSNLHSYYVDDLKVNNYYDDLKFRLEKSYPNSTYTNQYTNELASDKYMLASEVKKITPFNWTYILWGALSLSVILNVFLIYKNYNVKQTKVETLKQKLSNQERVVLNHLLQDKTNKAIAEVLFLSVSTIKTHINNIYKKLDVQSRKDIKSLFSS